MMYPACRLTQTTIKQKVSPQVEYLVQQLTDTSLVLGLELRGMQFVMHFRRGDDVPPNNNSTPVETPGGSQPVDSLSQEM